MQAKPTTLARLEENFKIGLALLAVLLQALAMETNLSPEEIVAWLRNQAKKFNDMATTIEQTFKIEPVVGAEGVTRYQRKIAPIAQPRTGTVTAEELEKSVAQKSGRVDDLAQRHNVEKSTITSLLEPKSKVYVAERGWLKVRE